MVPRWRPTRNRVAVDERGPRPLAADPAVRLTVAVTDWQAIEDATRRLDPPLAALDVAALEPEITHLQIGHGPTLTTPATLFRCPLSWLSC
jgi:hypothetical protein